MPQQLARMHTHATLPGRVLQDHRAHSRLRYQIQEFVCGNEFYHTIQQNLGSQRVNQMNNLFIHFLTSGLESCSYMTAWTDGEESQLERAFPDGWIYHSIQQFSLGE